MNVEVPTSLPVEKARLFNELLANACPRLTEGFNGSGKQLIVLDLHCMSALYVVSFEDEVATIHDFKIVQDFKESETINAMRIAHDLRG